MEGVFDVEGVVRMRRKEGSVPLELRSIRGAGAKYSTHDSSCRGRGSSGSVDVGGRSG